MDTSAKTTWIPRWLQPAPDSMTAQMAERGARSWLSLINLVWSLWLFSTPIFAPVGAPFYWSIAISFPVFLLLIALLHVRPNREGALYVTALTLLACTNLAFNGAAWDFAVFACAYIPWVFRESIWLSIVRMALVQGAVVVVAVVLGGPWQVIVMVVGICSFVGLGSLVGQVSMRRHTAERMSMDEVRHLAATAERERIGRDLHDLLGHTLSLITLKLELSRKLFDREPERARRELGDAEEVARHALAEVRAAVTGIRATGLAGEVASARLMLRTSGVEMDAGDLPALPAALDSTLALVLREAVTNIHRHARAERASVKMEVVDGHALMRVRDDGRGGVDVAGNGLKGMRERIAALHGTLRVNSVPGAGTELAIDVPLPGRDAVVPAPILDSGETVAGNVVSFQRPAGGRS